MTTSRRAVGRSVMPARPVSRYRKLRSNDRHTFQRKNCADMRVRPIPASLFIMAVLLLAPLMCLLQLPTPQLGQHATPRRYDSLVEVTWSEEYILCRTIKIVNIYAHGRLESPFMGAGTPFLAELGNHPETANYRDNLPWDVRLGLRLRNALGLTPVAGQSSIVVYCPHWPWVLGAALLYAFFHRRRHMYNATNRRCHLCGYDLMGNLSGRCPECGHNVSVTERVKASQS